MSGTTLLIVPALVFATCHASTADARQAAGPEAFLRRIYAPYIAGDATVNPTGKAAPTIFDTHLTALIRQDEAQPPGEVGALDQDPICDCQDFDREPLLVLDHAASAPSAKTLAVDEHQCTSLLFRRR